MRRLLLPLVVLVLAALASFGVPCLTGAALAQDAPSAEEVRRRVDCLRQLPDAEKARLKAALERFRALPAAERDALRAKAAAVGAERLEGLAGRDIDHLKEWRKGLLEETEMVLAHLGPERLAGLADAERAYVRSLAMRGFQRHLQRRVMQVGTYDDLEKIPHAERKSRMQAGLQRIVEERFAKLPGAEQDRIRALPPAERPAEKARMLADFRHDETLEFARVFDGGPALRKLLGATPEKRAEIVARWRDQNRWFAVGRVLRDEIAVSDEARRAFATLGPLEWARVAFEVSQSEALPPLERRAQIERTIHRLAGERGASDGRRPPPFPAAMRALRERRLLQGRDDAATPPPRR